MGKHLLEYVDHLEPWVWIQYYQLTLLVAEESWYQILFASHVAAVVVILQLYEPAHLLCPPIQSKHLVAHSVPVTTSLLPFLIVSSLLHN